MESDITSARGNFDLLQSPHSRRDWIHADLKVVSQTRAENVWLVQAPAAERTGAPPNNAMFINRRRYGTTKQAVPSGLSYLRQTRGKISQVNVVASGRSASRVSRGGDTELKQPTYGTCSRSSLPALRAHTRENSSARQRRRAHIAEIKRFSAHAPASALTTHGRVHSQDRAIAFVVALNFLRHRRTSSACQRWISRAKSVSANYCAAIIVARWGSRQHQPAVPLVQAAIIPQHVSEFSEIVIDAASTRQFSQIILRNDRNTH